MAESDRVRSHTDDDVNQDLDESRVDAVATVAAQGPAAISRRIHDLDREWDIERTLEANAASLMLLSLALGKLVSPRWRLLSAAVPAFLLQHSLQGWCPPMSVLRRLGVRTRGEIDAERTALKALRGDFDGLGRGGDGFGSARRAVRAAGRVG